MKILSRVLGGIPKRTTSAILPDADPPQSPPSRSEKTIACSYARAICNFTVKSRPTCEILCSSKTRLKKVHDDGDE